MSQPTVEQLTEKLGLKAHPEGGFYIETYKADMQVKAPYGERSAGTAIYFLVTQDSVSRLHKIDADETWHFYMGGPLNIVELRPSEPHKAVVTVLGNKVLDDQVLQYTVKAGTWFGCFPAEGTAYSLVGCTVTPGFEFEDFVLASRATLTKEFPNEEALITKLTVGLP